MILPTLDLEKKYWDQGLRVIVGIDEAGRGPLAGPVVAGAVYIVPKSVEKLAGSDFFTLIRDSKTLSAIQREKAFSFITENFPFGVGWSDHATIDRINILQSSYLAMKKAIADLRKKINEEIEVFLIDGQSSIPNFSFRQENILNGDRDIFSISAASIIAKVTRDRMMAEFHKEFPQYGFALHKGYGTKMHFEKLRQYGPCEIHRKSFRIVKPSS